MLHWDILRTSYFNVLRVLAEDVLRTLVGDVPWRYIEDHTGTSKGYLLETSSGRPRDVILQGGYIDSSYWIKKKKATITLINKKDSKYFQYTVTIALNHEEIKKDPQRITKIKPFINKYNWKEIDFPSEKDDWKKVEKNNRTIALNVLYAKKEKNISCLGFKT